MTALMQQAGTVADDVLRRRAADQPLTETLVRLMLAEAYSIGVRDGQQRQKSARRRRV